MKQKPEEIAAAYVSRWQSAWNSHGASAAAGLYTPDSVLVGAAIGIGRLEIERLLGLLYQQGWTRISIKVLNAREVGGMVLVAAEFSAVGSGPTAGKTLAGKSSHALTQIGDAWLSAMHTAA